MRGKWTSFYELLQDTKQFTVHCIGRKCTKHVHGKTDSDTLCNQLNLSSTLKANVAGDSKPFVAIYQIIRRQIHTHSNTGITADVDRTFPFLFVC